MPTPAFSRTTKRIVLCLATLIAATLLLTITFSVLAANQTWDGGAAGNGTAWYTVTNWAGDTAFPGSQSVSTNTDIASIGSTGTNPSLGINGTTSANLFLGAIDFSSASRAIGDSAAGSFTFTLNGATVNSVNNVIIRNSGSGNLTLQPQSGGAGTMSVALGNATDNIINIDGTGGVTISSSISGSTRKLTLGGAGTGTLTLSGTNTYTGDTTISSGKLSLGTAGLIANSANIVLAGGSAFDLSTHTSAIAMSSGQGLKGTGTTSTGTITLSGSGTRLQTATNSPLQFTAFSGATAPLTVAGSGSLVLHENNPVTVNTTVALGAGDYTLIAKSGTATVAIVSGIPPTSLTIGGSGLASGMTASLQLTGGQLVLHVAAAGSLQFSSATYSTAEGDSGTHNATITVTRAGGSAGAVSVHYATSNGTATAGSDYTATSGDLNWTDTDTAAKTFNVSVNGDTAFEPNETVNLTLSAPTGGATLGTPDTAVLTITNDDVNTISGTKTVCASGCDYATLTDAGGLFEAINNATVSGNITAVVSGDLSEHGVVALNQWTESGVGNYTLSVVPSDATTKTISGNATLGLIRLNGADRVTIDGRFGGAGRFLLFRNTSSAGATVSLTNDASSNTVRSSVIEGAVIDPAPGSPSVGVVTVGAGASTGNDNDTVTDNQIRDLSTAPGVPTFLFISAGTSPAVSNSNGTVSDNEVFNFRGRGIYVAGVTAGSSESWTVSGNTVYQTALRPGTIIGISVAPAGTNTVSGNTVHDLTSNGSILRGFNLVMTGTGTTNVTRNRVYSLTNTAVGNTETSGMVVSPNDTTTVNVSNNMLSVVPSGSNDQGVLGFYEQGAAGTTVNFFYNTVLVGGTSTGASPSWACARNSAPTASASTWRDNICFNNRTGGGANHFAAGNQSALGSFSSDYNVFVGTGAVASDFMDYGTADAGTPVSFAVWQSSTGGDSHSLASNPGGDYTVANMFASAIDLHLNTAGTNPASNAGAPVAGVTNDYDNQTRDTVIPDIGADEVAGTTSLQFSSATYSVSEGTAFVTITVTRTGSSVGIATVHYATSDGTASEAGDYGAQTDSFIWQDGDVSPKTFNVPINDDTLYEGNETFNVTLTQLNGALGTPSVATVTINDNDPAPTVSVGDVTVAEPSTGITYAVFPVTLSAASGLTTTVNFATSDGTATQPGDYTAAAGTLSFAPGETSKTVAVIVKADAVSEGPETFNLTLSAPSNATVADGTGVATITAPVGAGTVLINEFRLRGPGDPNSALVDTDTPIVMERAGGKGGRPVADTGNAPDEGGPNPVIIIGGIGGGPNAPPFPPETDEFVEVYNNTDADITVTDANPVTCAAQVITLGLPPAQACGWALVDLQGSVSNVPRFVIPVGATIPARGHYLAASTGYSLSALAAPDLTYNPPAYSGGEADYTGLALFKTADRAQFSAPNVFDAVGFDGVATPFREGSGLLPPTGVTDDVQFSFVRNQTSSRPSDTGDNRADFTLVATTPSLLLSGVATLGAPGPENRTGLVSQNGGFAVTIPPNVASSLRNNTTVTNGSLGTLSLRRRFTNNTGQTLSKLRFRVVNLTTYNSKQIFANQAEVRLLDAQLTGLGGTGLLATTVETPPNQTSGGGVNSGLVVSGSLVLAQPLAAGQSVDVEFLLGVMKSGSYQFVVVVEGAQ